MTTEGLRILLVQSSGSVASTICTFLERRGHRVSVLGTGLPTTVPVTHDVVIVDAEGLAPTTLSWIEGEIGRLVGARIVVLSNTRSTRLDRLRVSAKEVRYLPKPFSLPELLGIVEGQLQPEGRRTSRHGELHARTYRAVSGACSQSARDLCAFAMSLGIGPSTRARIGGAVAELTENVVRHAYPPGISAVARFRVIAEMSDRELSVQVVDHGMGIDPEGPLQRGGICGGGLLRAERMAESLEVDSELGIGTTVRLTFHAFRAHFDEEAHIDLSELDFLTPELTRRVMGAMQLDPRGEMFQFSPALAVVVGRLLAPSLESEGSRHPSRS